MSMSSIEEMKIALKVYREWNRGDFEGEAPTPTQFFDAHDLIYDVLKPMVEEIVRQDRVQIIIDQNLNLANKRIKELTEIFCLAIGPEVKTLDDVRRELERTVGRYDGPTPLTVLLEVEDWYARQKDMTPSDAAMAALGEILKKNPLRPPERPAPSL